MPFVLQGRSTHYQKHHLSSHLYAACLHLTWYGSDGVIPALLEWYSWTVDSQTLSTWSFFFMVDLEAKNVPILLRSKAKRRQSTSLQGNYLENRPTVRQLWKTDGHKWQIVKYRCWHASNDSPSIISDLAATASVSVVSCTEDFKFWIVSETMDKSV